ncbi:MAG: N-ethylammeline chlorohydrolase, partial [Clostridiales bacterium]|nr:N-ethylammeline chlorohydrolase [Clostridiales bacterium]
MDISKTLIKNARIFPGVENGQAKPVIEAGCVLIKGNRFAYVGPEAACPAGRPGKVIDAGGRLLMPALVNAHTHSAMTLLRGVGGEKPLEVWLREHIFPLEERLVAQQARAGVALAMLEYL